jgi:PAS domain S-box-containing protein
MKIENKWSKITGWFISRPRLSTFIVFLALLVLICPLVLQRYEIIKENREQEMSNILHVVQQNLNHSLKNCYTTTISLAMIVNDNGEPENFDALAKVLVESNPTIDAVQLVPNGIIKYTYPNNPDLIDFDILNTKSVREEALETIQKGKIHFAGPLKLKQGGLGVIGRLPIYRKGKFWGFSAVMMRLETLFKSSGINSIKDSRYYFQFSKENPKTGKTEFFLPNKENFADKYFQVLSIPDGNWKVYLISKNKYGLISEIRPALVLTVLFCFIFSLFLTSLLKKPAELQLLVHDQKNKILNDEIKFKSIFDHAAVGIAHVDSRTGCLIEVNDQYSRMLGYTFEEMRNMSFRDITYKDDLEENLKQLERLKSGEIRELTIEKRYIHKNGNLIWVNIAYSPLWQEGEEPSSHISIVEDITSKREAEDAIRKSEIRFKSLFEDSPIALWEEDFSYLKNYLEETGLIGKNREEVKAFFDANPEVVQKCISLVKIINVNNECLTLHHPKTKEDLIERLGDVLNNDSMDSFKAQLVAITQGETRLTIDSKVKKTDGEYRDISLRWSVMPGYEETLERIIISTEDITARKISEEIVIQSQKKMESLINTIDGIVWECDYNTYIFTYVNQKAEEITGYTREEWCSDGNFWANTIHPDDKTRAVNYCAIESKKSQQYDFEYRMIAKNGSVLWIRDIVNVIYENGKPVSLKGIMIDITKSKEAEKDLSNSLELVTEQNKRLLNFSYIVSHNLRSHTSNIQSISTLIETAETEEERNELVKMLQNVSNTLNETMLNLNEVINIQTNINLIIENLNIKDNIDRIINIVSEQIAFKKAVIKNNVSPEIFVKYNPAYLESILLNFISNAIRYCHPERNPVIILNSYFENDKTVLEIADNGLGIDLTKYGDKLFGMYKTFHENPDSKGIGLFITKNQIDAMGGTVTVESEPNTGTTFKIYFK